MSVSASTKASSSSQLGPRATCRSQVLSSYSQFSLPEHTSTSLLTMPSNLEAQARAERLERWMLRSSMQSTQSWSTTSDMSRPSSAAVRVRQNKLGRPTKTSMLRSKTCPAALTDYREQIQKQKVFDFRCKVLSASISSQTLPNGETFHGFLLGARYNSAYTVDNYSRERYGVHVLKKQTDKLFVNRVVKQPSAKIFGNLGSKDSHDCEPRSLVDYSINTSSEPHLQQVESIENDSLTTGSIEGQLDEVFGPNEEDSCSETTEVSVDNTSVSSHTLTSTSDDQKQSPRCDRISLSSQQDSNKAISQLSLSHLDTQSEENEQDFISHEAQELTQEILKECQISTSSFSNHNIGKAQTDIPTNAADSTHSELQAKCMEDKSLQTSLERIDNGECLSECSSSGGSNTSKDPERPVSAPFHRETNAIELFDNRSQSAGLSSQNKTTSSIVVDMTSLQTVETEDR